MTISYLKDGEDEVAEINAKQTSPNADRKDGRLGVSKHRLVYESGGGNGVTDISLDAIESMEYSKQSLWNQWTAGGVLVVIFGFFTQILFGILSSAFEAFTSFEWLALVPIAFFIFGLGLAAYGVLARKKVLKVKTGNETYGFATSRSSPKRLMHAIRSVRDLA